MKKIVVDCERNDPVDIRCGGPDYLGFDFYVEDEEVNELKDVVLRELAKNNKPCLSIYVEDEERQNVKVWDEKQIIECIKKGY